MVCGRLYAYLTPTFVSWRFPLDTQLKRNVTKAELEEKYDNKITRYKANGQHVVIHTEE